MANEEDFIRRRPVAGMAIALGIGALLQTVAKTMEQQRSRPPATARPDGDAADEGTPVSPRWLPDPPSPGPDAAPDAAPDAESARRTHDTGAADMQFTAHHPDGKRIEFRFAWKKRPVEAPDADWPTDDMGFTVERPSGKRIAFSFTRKTRPLPDAELAIPEPATHSGLGRANMEFVSSRPGRGDFRFVWKKRPPESAPD